MELITHNPYRILGVYGGEGITVITGNLSRMRAYLNVGKNCDMPTDATKMLPAVLRSLPLVEEAFSQINLPIEKVRHALFWFANGSPLDVAALENLQAGNVEKAIEIWEKRDTFSTLLNRAVVAFLSKRHRIAIQYLLSLIHTTEYREKFLIHIAGQECRLTEKEVSQLLVDTLLISIKPEDIWIVSKESPTYQITSDYLREKLSKKYIDEIERSLAKSLPIEHNKATQRYQAGVTLMHDTRTPLAALRKILEKKDVKYQMIADKLAIEILQCGIDYYNNSNDTDSIDKSLPLQKYALSIAVGKQAKERCQENVNIMLGNKEAKEVDSETQFILNQLEIYGKKYTSVANAGQLVTVCTPYLQRLEQALGSEHTMVIDYSAAVANQAVGIVIDAINTIQNNTAIHNITPLRNAVQEALNVISALSRLHIDPETSSRLKGTREALIKLRDDWNAAARSYFSSSSGSSSSSSGSSDGCYIATMVYGDYEHPQVKVLREFRDNCLKKYAPGRSFIRFYYRYSPGWVEQLKDSARVNSVIKKILDIFIKIISHDHV